MQSRTKKMSSIDPLADGTQTGAKWTFLTNHSHVLICVWREPFLRTRDIADRVGITERSVQRILTDLTEYGVLSRQKDGRRNLYSIDVSHALRHPLEAHRAVRDLLELVGADDQNSA